MSMFLLNIVFAIIWMVITGLFKPENFLGGFAIAYLILWLLHDAIGGPSSYFSKVRQTAGFVVFFLKELFKANLRVARDVLTITHHMQPGVVAVPLDVETDLEITLLANLITLTPGTLSLDVSDDRKILYVHGMYVNDLKQFRKDIKEGFERRVMELLR
ncbi:MAG: Na+/H+ antiporter subunit E [Deltaproteobacteria bacterium]|nr:Na+/H+ antiporter subunit E [Deltaproteobacteria bacterium]